MKKFSALLLKVLAWVGIASIGCLGAYAVVQDIFFLHPAWQWPTFEAGFIILSLGGIAFMLRRKVAGYALVATGLAVWDVVFFSTWHQGVLFANILAIAVAVTTVGYVFIAFNERRYN